jgi:hypothetical protein
VIVLVVGLLSSVAVIVTAADPSSNATAYEVVNGVSYPVDVADTKRYQSDMERIGGKTSLLATDLGDWFSALWHGRQLGVTVGLLSVALSLLCFYLAHLLSFPPLDDEVDDGQWKG